MVICGPGSSVSQSRNLQQVFALPFLPIFQLRRVHLCHRQLVRLPCWPGALNLMKTQKAIFFATGFERRGVFKLPLERIHHLAEFRCINFVSIPPFVLQEIVQFDLRRCPHLGLQALTEGPSVHVYFAKVISAWNVLKQMRHFRKRPPVAVFRQMIFALSGTRVFLLCFHYKKLWGTMKKFAAESGFEKMENRPMNSGNLNGASCRA